MQITTNISHEQTNAPTHDCHDFVGGCDRVRASDHDCVHVRDYDCAHARDCLHARDCVHAHDHVRDCVHVRDRVHAHDRDRDYAHGHENDHENARALKLSNHFHRTLSLLRAKKPLDHEDASISKKV